MQLYSCIVAVYSKWNLYTVNWIGRYSTSEFLIFQNFWFYRLFSCIVAVYQFAVYKWTLYTANWKVRSLLTSVVAHGKVRLNWDSKVVVYSKVSRNVSGELTFQFPVYDRTDFWENLPHACSKLTVYAANWKIRSLLTLVVVYSKVTTHFTVYSKVSGPLQYGVATISRLFKIIGLFCRISSLL